MWATHHPCTHTPLQRQTQLGFYGSRHFMFSSLLPSQHLECSYFLWGRTFSSTKPWLTTLPAGNYLATTKEDPSLADAFPTPIFLVFFHTMAVKCPVPKVKPGCWKL